MSIKNYLPKIKIEIYDAKINSPNLLEMWTEKHSNRPIDNLTPYVLHKSFIYDIERFVILISTQQLLSNTIHFPIQSGTKPIQSETKPIQNETHSKKGLN